MSDMLLTIAVTGATPGKAIGIKEALAMDVEKYGDVRVLRVEVLEPEQMALGDAVPEQRTAPSASHRHPAQVPPGGQAQATHPRPESHRPQRSLPGNMSCCLNCEFYRQESGMDENGKFRWGMCRRTGQAVRELKDRCGAWTQEQTI